MRIIALLVLVLCSSRAFAQTCDPSDTVNFVNCIPSIDTKPRTPSCPNCEEAASTCAKNYERLFADGTVNSTIIWGYNDNGGGLEDGVLGEFEKNEVIEKLTGPCPATYSLMSDNLRGGKPHEIQAVTKDREQNKCGGNHSLDRSCGFKRGDDPEILTKTMLHKGRTINLHIRILGAELTPRDSENRSNRGVFVEKRLCEKSSKEKLASCIQTNSKLNSSELAKKCTPGDHELYQVCRSAYARNVWRSSIENGDEIVMYNGHARGGGGPSFDPPKLLPSGKVDYEWYRKVREGHTQETESFKKAKKAPVIYGSLSCDSKLHFETNGSFPEVSPSTAFISSKRTIYGDEAIAALLTSLNGVYGGQCDLNEKIRNASCGFGLSGF